MIINDNKYNTIYLTYEQDFCQKNNTTFNNIIISIIYINLINNTINRLFLIIFLKREAAIKLRLKLITMEKLFLGRGTIELPLKLNDVAGIAP